VSGEPLFVLAVLGLNVAASEWLARHTFLRHLSSALVVIVLTAITANLGIVPTYGAGSPIYDGVFEYVAPFGIFLLLLRVNLRGLRRAGAPLLSLFLVGSAGTVAGVFAGLAVVGWEAFGERTFALGGMFVGTYVGGSVNFNAIAQHYGVMNDATLYLGATVVDASMTAVWMAACVAIPRLLARGRARAAAPSAPDTGEREDTEPVHFFDLALVAGVGFLAVWLSELLTTVLARAGLAVPSMLVLTVIALACAQTRAVHDLPGTRLVGMLAIMLFLAVIGALCDLQALRGLGAIGVRMSGFVAIVVLVHGLITFGAGALLKQDPVLSAVASQANIGGGTSALAVARSLGRGDLVLPAILIGSLGNAIGNFLGFWTASMLR
jgi:uncharacterized membrane protein